MNNLDEILKNIKLEDISSEGTGFSELPDGYYLCEVEEVKFAVSKTTGNDMLSWRLKVVENGINFDDNFDKKYIQNTKNRKIFMFSSLRDQASVEKTISDLMKFEKEEGVSLLQKEYFINKEIMTEALALLIGLNIYVQLDTDKDGNQWKRFVNWKGAQKLGLV